MNQLPVIIKQAQRLTSDSDSLVQNLKDLLINNTTVTVNEVNPIIGELTIFLLACFVGYYVIWKVTPALHTPLMSITNAISSIIIIGSMIAASSINFNLSNILGYIAVFFASVNIFGGFVVTQRMLSMFKKK